MIGWIDWIFSGLFYPPGRIFEGEICVKATFVRAKRFRNRTVLSPRWFLYLHMSRSLGNLVRFWYGWSLFIYCFFLKYRRGSRIMTIFCGCQTFIAENPCMASDFRSVNFRRDPHTHRPTGSRQVSQVFEYRWAVWSIPGHHLFGKQLWVILPVTCGRNWQFVAAALKERLVQQLSSGQTWIVNVKLQPFYFKQTEQLTHSTHGGPAYLFFASGPSVDFLLLMD